MRLEPRYPSVSSQALYHWAKSRADCYIILHEINLKISILNHIYVFLMKLFIHVYISKTTVALRSNNLAIKSCAFLRQENQAFNICLLPLSIFVFHLQKRPRQTGQTQIRLLLKDQSNKGLPCLLFWNFVNSSLDKTYILFENRKRSILKFCDICYIIDLYLSYDIAYGSDIPPCFKIDKPLVV